MAFGARTQELVGQQRAGSEAAERFFTNLSARRRDATSVRDHDPLLVDGGAGGEPAEVHARGQWPARVVEALPRHLVPTGGEVLLDQRAHTTTAGIVETKDDVAVAGQIERQD